MSDAHEHECSYNEATLRYVSWRSSDSVLLFHQPYRCDYTPMLEIVKSVTIFKYNTPGYWRRTPISYRTLLLIQMFASFKKTTIVVKLETIVNMI
jgi:hypothetical protein